VLLAAWTLATSAGRPHAHPLPVLALIVIGAGLFWASRLAAERWDELVPGLVALAVAGAFVLTFPGVMSSGGAPTEYGNTNGTLAALGAIAAAAVAPTRRGSARLVWLAVASWLVACVAMSESVGAGVALAVAGILAGISVLRQEATIAALGGLVATWLGLGATGALATGTDAGRLGEHQALRTALWARALDLAREAPWRGTGPATYSHHHAVSTDADLRWAHHEYLQQAAETGWVGLVLVLLLVAWLFAYLWWGRRRGLARTVAGASAVTVVALHATVDHVLHTAVVPLTLAVLVGWATADPRARGGPGSPGSRRPPR
jgi:O-antigen ligase